MATVAEPKLRMTLAQFADLPPDAGHEFKLELVEGELVEMPRPTFEHNELIAGMLSLIQPFVRERKVGRVSMDCFVLFDPDGENSFAPDLVFLSSDRIGLLRDGNVCGAPDLVVEVLSPATWRDDYGRKFVAYHKGEIPWYWIVDPDTLRIEEHRYSPEGYVRTQTILHGDEFRPGCFPELVINLAALRSAK